MVVVVQNVKDAPEKKIITKQRRVFVIGMDVVTSLGHDPDTFYNNLLQGKSGVSEIKSFDCKDFPTKIAGEIQSFSIDGWVAPKLSKRMDKSILYMLISGKKALAIGGTKVFNDVVEALRISYRKMNPFCVPFEITNMGSAMMEMDLGWMGPNYSISTTCATSNLCLIVIANHIVRGGFDCMFSSGSDVVIIPIGLGGFVACRALSERKND